MGVKALILGASGQVGQALAQECVRRGWSWAGSYHEHALDGGLFPLNLGDLEAVRDVVLRQAPETVFLPSGWTWVDGCEDDPGRAHLLNALAPEAAARACAEVGAGLVTYSTDYIFGEHGGPYDETALSAPLGAYGRSKLAGESLVLKALPGALVLRTTVVYGPEPQGKNSVYQLLKGLRSGKAVVLPSDQTTSPTYNRDLARGSLDLVEAREVGLFNVAGSELIDRYAFGRLVAEVFGLDAALVRPALTRDLSQKAARPLDSGLDIGKLGRTLGWRPLGPRDGLQRMKAELENDVLALGG